MIRSHWCWWRSPLPDLAILDSPPYFLDTAPLLTVFGTLSILVALILFQVTFPPTAPRLYASHQTFFSISEIDMTSTLDFNITIANLSDIHRLLHIDGALVRRRSLAGPRQLGYSVRPIFSTNQTVTNKRSHWRGTFMIDFASITSQPFCLLRQEIVDYDMVSVRVSLTGDFREITGLGLRWLTVDPAFVDCSRFMRSVLSALNGYMLIVHLVWLDVCRLQLGDVLCVALGVCGVFACNPQSFWNPPPAIPPLADHVFVAAFVAMLRMFCLLQLDLLRARRVLLNKFAVLCAGAFYTCYGVVDAAAGFERSQASREASPVLLFAAVLQRVHVLVSLLWVAAAFIRAGAAFVNRLYVFVFAVVIDVCSTWFSRVDCLTSSTFAYAPIPEMVNLSIHMTTGAFIVLLMRHESIPEKHDGASCLDTVAECDTEPLYLK
jgi:hypothetical protein